MATTLASLVVRIGADVTGVTAGLNTLDKRMRSLKRQFGSVKDSTLTWQGALGALAGATGLAFAANKVFELGAAVEETASKFNTVFGPSVDDAQQFLDDFANTAGLTINQGRDLLATTGAIAQGMGFSQKASADFAQEIVKLSGDLTSFNNVPIAETSHAIQSALTGERESLKRLGIVILEADVQARALAMTGKTTATSLTQQEKATATLALITERAGVAVGDLARTMDSPANRARRLIAQVLTLRDTISHALLPALTVVLGELEKIGGSGGFQGLGDQIATNANVIAAWAKFAIEAFKFVGQAITTVIRLAFNLGEAIGKTIVMAVQLMTGQWSAAKDTFVSMRSEFDAMKDAVGDLVTRFDNMRVASGIAWDVVASGTETVQANTAAAREAAAATTEEADSSGVLAAVMERVNEAFERHLAIAKRGIEITMQNRTEQEIYNDRMRELDALLAAGAITQQTYERATLAASAALRQQTQETNALAAAQSKLSAITSLLSGFGFNVPFFGQVGSILSAANAFSGGFAEGGTIPAGRWGVVGERGPEVVRGPATVSPGAAMPPIVLSVPPARDPITLARDRQWMDAFHEMMERLKHSGYRFAN